MKSKKAISNATIAKSCIFLTLAQTTTQAIGLNALVVIVGSFACLGRQIKMLDDLNILIHGIPYEKQKKSVKGSFCVSDIRNIRERRKNGETIKVIARDFSTSVESIYSILKWETYRYIDPHLKEDALLSFKKIKERLSDDEVRQMRDKRKNGATLEELTREYGRHITSVTKITNWSLFSSIDPHLKYEYLAVYETFGHGLKTYKVTEEIAEKMVLMKKQGLTYGVIGDAFNIPKHVIKSCFSLERKESRSVFERYKAEKAEEWKSKKSSICSEAIRKNSDTTVKFNT